MMFNFYGQNSKGNSGPVKSCDIEKKFQSHPTGSFTFNVGAETLEIRFTGAVNSQHQQIWILMSSYILNLY